MNQSEYTKISKSIGLEGKPIDLPTLQKAENLHNKVMNDRSVEAFREVFRLYRFGRSPESFSEEEVSNQITSTFCEGGKFFK